MRYVMLTEAVQPPTAPPAELMEAIMKLGEEATAAGALLDNAGLLPSSAGAMITVTGGGLTVTDGPFAETKELISYAVYSTRSREEAVEWGSRFMKVHRDLWAGWEGTCRILQVMEF